MHEINSYHAKTSGSKSLHDAEKIAFSVKNAVVAAKNGLTSFGWFHLYHSNTSGFRLFVDVFVLSAFI